MREKPLLVLILSEGYRGKREIKKGEATSGGTPVRYTESRSRREKVQRVVGWEEKDVSA